MHSLNEERARVVAGVVELREDVPLAGRGGGSARCGGAGGPRLIAGCFAALSVSITVALVTQMYYGEREVAPHGSVSSSAAECSRAGTDALQAGGRAMDAAAAAALCLAVLAPHRTSLDAYVSLYTHAHVHTHTHACTHTRTLLPVSKVRIKTDCPLGAPNVLKKNRKGFIYAIQNVATNF